MSDVVRTLPWSEQSEMAVLGGCMNDADAFDDAGWLSPDDFHPERHRKLWAAMQGAKAAGEVFDPAAMWEALKRGGMTGDPDWLAELDEFSYGAAVAPNARIVSELAALRSLLRQCAQSYESGMTGRIEDVPAFCAEVRTAADHAIEALTLRRGSGFVGAGALYASRIEALEARMRGEDPARRFTTGITGLDNILNPMAAGQFIVVGARPNVGKTALGLQIACNAANDGARVLFFSLEQTKDEIGDRMIAQTARVPLDCLVRGSGLTERIVNRIIATRRRVDAWDMEFLDLPRMSPGEVRAAARREIRTGGPVDLVVVDHLHHVKSDTPNDSRYREVSEVSKAFKALPKELDCAALVLAQLSRKNVDGAKARPPAVSDLRDSGTIEEDADAIVLIHRDDVHNPNSSEVGLARLNVAKQRDGKTGRCAVAFRGEMVRFDALAADHEDSGRWA